MNMMKRKLLLIGVSVSMLIGAVSVAASSGVELHEFFNAKGERVMYPYPLGTFKENHDLSIEREEMYHAIRKFRSTKAIFTL